MTAFHSRTFAACFVLLVAGRTVPAAEPPAVIATEAKFLPDGCQMIGVVHVQKLLNSEVYRQLKKDSPRVAKQEATISANLPIPLEQIETIVFGGGVTGNEEGLFIVHTRPKIKPDNLAWSKTTYDLPVVKKIGKYEMYERLHESFCLVGDNLVVVGRASILRSVLDRDAAPDLSATLVAALNEADLSATAAVVLDVAAVHRNRSNGALQFIPGLQMVRAEGATKGLALSAKFDAGIELSVTALAATDAGGVTLREEADRFALWHRTTLKEGNAPEEVVDIFKLNIGGDPKRVTVSTKFSPAAGARLLKWLGK